MDSHKNLMHSPRRFKEFPLWTLSLLRGGLPVNFFYQIENYIQNWGVQYFFASLFNQKIGGHIIVELIERLEDLYGVCFNRELGKFSFHVSGNDSSLSHELNKRFSDVFPNQARNERTDKLIAYSDLCLILENDFTKSSVAIFGEVEGSYGNKFRSEKYWGKKHDLCVFGIGTTIGDNKSIYFEESHHRGIPRVHLIFEKSHFAISDFIKTIKSLSWLFLHGPDQSFQKIDDEFDYFIEYLIKNWNEPIETIFVFLEKFIAGDDLVGFNKERLEIITDIQS